MTPQNLANEVDKIHLYDSHYRLFTITMNILGKKIFIYA